MTTLLELLNPEFHPWAATALAAAIALTVVWLGFWLAMPVVRRLTQSRQIARTVIYYLQEPARLLATLLALQAVWHNAPSELHFIVAIDPTHV